MIKKSLIVFFLFIIFCTTELFAATISIKSAVVNNSADHIYKIVCTEKNKTIAKHFYQNGKTVLSEGDIPKNLDQIVEARGYYNAKGFLQKIVYLKQGSARGEGVRQSDGSFKSTGVRPDGIIINYDEHGLIRGIKTQTNGKCQGPAIAFYPNGQLKACFHYKDDYPEGICKKYYDNGRLMVEQKLIGKKLIYHKEFDQNGELKPPPISKLPHNKAASLGAHTATRP